MNFNSVPAHSFPHKEVRELEKNDPLYTPGPGKYSPSKTLFHYPTWKIGTTERKVFQVLQKYPGPGAYSIPQDIQNGPKYTMSKKNRLIDEAEKFGFPGPANYKPLKKSNSCFYYSFGLKTKPKERDITPGPGNYNIRQEKALKKPSYIFGREKREERNMIRKTPGPGKYEYNADPVRVHHPNFSFGSERRGRSDGFITPGPGNYKHKIFIGENESRKSTIGIKYNLKSLGGTITPGPGHYKDTKVDFYRTKSPNYKLGTDKRKTSFKQKTDDYCTPGPGQYNDTDKVKYVRIRNPSWKIGTSVRKGLSYTEDCVPGVGNYTISGTPGKGKPNYSMRIKGKMSNNDEDVPGPGQYKNEKMNLYKKYPSWKIGTSQRDSELIRTIKQGYPGPGNYGHKTISDFFSPKYRFGKQKRLKGYEKDTPGPGQYHIPCSMVDVAEYTREKGSFEEKYKFI